MKIDLLLFLTALGILAMSTVMFVIPPDRVAFCWLPERVVPHLCWSQSVAQFTCPGCGITRSIISMTHGSLDESLRFHRLGWALWLTFALQIPYRGARLAGWHAPRWWGDGASCRLAMNGYPYISHLFETDMGNH